MELNDFIKTTLVEIQLGVKEANISIAEIEETPVRTEASMQYMLRANRSGEREKGILFDVAVTASNDATSDLAGKINVIGIGFGANRESSNSEQVVSRIKFKVDPFNDVY
jgi:hypothetical protein